MTEPALADRVTLVRDDMADGLARLRLARPSGRNGIDMAMVLALAGALDTVAADPGVRALLIDAEGPAFTVGGDLRHLGGQADRLPTELHEMISRYHRTLGQLAELPIPVLVAAHGAAFIRGMGQAGVATTAKPNPRFPLPALATWHRPTALATARALRLIDDHLDR